ncbi:MAG: sugar phosphate nucleotidyltransferase, partial [Candidatus Sumerlaeota bacterium]|nr:sugar phosphate nucleotidyltransferase [Candidatus Sumerlaeota bacterium]
MKGVILAGGAGSRLFPLTRVTNKHLLPVGKMPMLYYPILKMTGAGIRHILVVTGVEHMGSIVGLLGSGREFDCQFTYRVQDEAGGIAQALALAEDFTQGERIVVILGDNIFHDSIQPMAERFHRQKRGARLALKE